MKIITVIGRGLIRSQQAYYLEKKKSQRIKLKVNYNKSGQYLFQVDS